MADLMSGTYTYEGLASTYDNFCVPVVKVKISGSDVISSQKLAVVNFRLSLSTEGASMAVIKIGGEYDEKNHTFTSKVKNTFAPGTVAEVQIGYKSSTESLFKGFVASLGAEFSRIPMLVVTLMDARRLMMISGSQYVLHDVKNYSDVFSQVMSRYTKLCSTEVDATSDNLTRPVSQTQDDYQFVTRELIASGRADREFFILGSKAYFRKPRKVKSPIMTMKYGRELLALKTDESYLDLKVDVVGYDPEQQKELTGTATVKGSSMQSKVMGSTPEYYITDPEADTQEKTTEKATSAADRLGWKARRGQGMTIGLPVIVPGRFVKVESMDKDLCDHKYYLKSVIHEINGEDYKTMFEIEGWD